MEKQLVEADAGTNRDTGDGRRAFRAPINDVFINVYEPISDFVSPWLSSGFQWFKGCGCHSGSAVHPSRFTTSSFKALFTHYKRRGTTINPSGLGGTVNNYIGKSQYADPYLAGSLDEFRIYNIGLSSAEIAATTALGPNQLLSTNRPQMGMALTGTNRTISWPLANAGFTLQSRTNLTLGNWVNLALPAPQIVGSNWQVSLPVSASNLSIFLSPAEVIFF